MNPKIVNYREEDGVLNFTLNGVDVCFANAIRRTLLADIPTVVFKTMPYEANTCSILDNTSRLNNEILKQRLSCIPIHINDLAIPLKEYLLELDEENTTDTMMYVTTQHFKIKNIVTDKYLEEKDLRTIFPSYVPPTGKGEYFIEFCRLRPKISEDIPGEKIRLNCEFSISTAKDDSMFNIAGTCAYGYSPDPEKIKEELIKRQQVWKDESKTKEEIDFESENWKLLEGLRYVKPNSFDFILQSVGVFENKALLQKACDIIMNKLLKLESEIKKDEVKIEPSVTTMENCYDFILENEDYTIGNILNHILYMVFYKDTKLLSFCGFKKMHPHDTDSIIRFAFSSPISNKASIKTMFNWTITEAIKVFTKLKEQL